MRILAIDPGPEKSAWVLIDEHGALLSHQNQEENQELLHKLRHWATPPDILAMEDVKCYGMAVGQSVFLTCKLIGQVEEICFSRGWPMRLMYEPKVRIHHCGVAKAKTSNLRRAILDRYERTGGGANPEIGTKKKPGPLYGFSGEHTLSALALGLAILDTTTLNDKYDI